MTPELSLQGAQATIRLRRPQQANRLNRDDLTMLASHIAQVDRSPEVLVLRFESGGKYFCSGFDIGQIDPASPSSFDAVINAVEDCRAVTVCVVHGGVYGGATDLALACDFRLGTLQADMFMPAARLGLHFYQRGLQRYVSRLGVDMAKRLFLTAEKLDAAQMKACGFLTHLVDGPALAETADTLCATLAGMAPLALLGMKRHLNTIARGELDVAGLQADIARCAQSGDIREGQAAWAQKRAPQFTGS